jgi:hypothetical protein
MLRRVGGAAQALDQHSNVRRVEGHCERAFLHRHAAGRRRAVQAGHDRAVATRCRLDHEAAGVGRHNLAAQRQQALRGAQQTGDGGGVGQLQLKLAAVQVQRQRGKLRLAFDHGGAHHHAATHDARGVRGLQAQLDAPSANQHGRHDTAAVTKINHGLRGRRFNPTLVRSMSARSQRMVEAAVAQQRQADKQHQLRVLRMYLSCLDPYALFNAATAACKCAPLYENVWGCAADLEPRALIDTIISTCDADERLLWLLITDRTYGGERIGFYALPANCPELPWTGDLIARFIQAASILCFILDRCDAPMCRLVLEEMSTALQSAQILKPVPHHATVKPWLPLLGACLRSSTAVDLCKSLAQGVGYTGLDEFDNYCHLKLERLCRTASPSLYCDETLELTD